jgi:YD repeat-containing protein
MQYAESPTENQMHRMLSSLYARYLPAIAAAVLMLAPASVGSSAVIYGYDPVGRLATAKYDDGTCVVYAYDANGNRTSAVTTRGGTPELAEWGSGVWGCLAWSPA